MTPIKAPFPTEVTCENTFPNPKLTPGGGVNYIYLYYKATLDDERTKQGLVVSWSAAKSEEFIPLECSIMAIAGAHVKRKGFPN